MGTEISSPIQLTNSEFELIQAALQAYAKKCKSNARICKTWYTGKVTTEMKARDWNEKAEFCDEIESKLSEGFF